MRLFGWHFVFIRVAGSPCPPKHLHMASVAGFKELTYSPITVSEPLLLTLRPSQSGYCSEAIGVTVNLTLLMLLHHLIVRFDGLTH